uniref:50S ribosomal protein L19, chloroplastic n=1 Tax=Paulinella chromatophora TaxID=39717 RepID=B1X3G3_PAUCH|nr:50S ribosomal protein L19 [Paulinella chromatophora]ACB42482.1 50S ribosomal protein L19 [Paulinella chromatophora]
MQYGIINRYNHPLARGSKPQMTEDSNEVNDLPTDIKSNEETMQGVTISKTKRLSPYELIKQFEAAQLKDEKDLPEIYVGDTVSVGVRISEGNKQRTQPYEGVVIAKRHGGLNETITVRRIFQGVGVERVFMLHSPQVASIEVERRGKVRRAKLFYLRDRVGKATRVKQRFDR